MLFGQLTCRVHENEKQRLFCHAKKNFFWKSFFLCTMEEGIIEKRIEVPNFEYISVFFVLFEKGGQKNKKSPDFRWNWGEAFRFCLITNITIHTQSKLTWDLVQKNFIQEQSTTGGSELYYHEVPQPHAVPNDEDITVLSVQILMIQFLIFTKIWQKKKFQESRGDEGAQNRNRNALQNQTIHPVKYLVKSGPADSDRFLNHNYLSEWTQGTRSFKMGQIWLHKNGKKVILLGMRHANPLVQNTRRK